MSHQVSSKEKVKIAFETTLIRVGNVPERQKGFVNPPLYRGSTVLYDSVSEMENSQMDGLKRTAPVYGRFGTPTTRSFEVAMTELEGGYDAVCTVTGLSAITTAILSFVQTGDHLLISDSVYLPTRNFCESLRRFGIDVEYYDPEIGHDIKNFFRPQTKLVFLESPGSLTFEIQDVPEIAKACRARGIVTMIDNTWATPCFYRPMEFGVDVVIHAATKYITGHSDSFLGVIVCNEACFTTVRSQAIRLGQCAGAEDIQLGLRGLRTLSLRLRKHQEQALGLAQWLSRRSEVAEVFHPALPGSVGHDLWKRDFKGSSGLFSIILQEGYEKSRVDTMLNVLRLFGLGHSWGGYESLIVPAQPEVYRTKGRWRKRGVLLRLHAGLEDLEDLKADLAEGFRWLVSPSRTNPSQIPNTAKFF